jgi:cytochrome c556
VTFPLRSAVPFAVAGAVLCAAVLPSTETVRGAAPAPAKIADLATVEDLVAEIDAELAALTETLADAAGYAEARKAAVPQAAGVVACCAQALVEHPAGRTALPGAANLRDSAVAVWKATQHADAVAALAACRDARSGKATGAPAEADWNKLIRLGRMMEEINGRCSKLRTVIRKPKDPAADARIATTVAVLALAMEVDTHEVKNPAEIPAWKSMSGEFRRQMVSVAAALRKGDAETAKTAFTAAAKSCNDCHEKFRDAEEKK